MKDFRQIVRWPWRVLDFACHVTLALILPGHWWYQFLPDFLVTPIFLYGWITGRLLNEKNPVLRVHKFLHTVWPAFIAIPFSLSLAVQWALHLVVDLYTHPEPEFKKELW